VNFTETLERFEPPWYTQSYIDPDTYLPLVDGAGFERQSAGVKTMINDAYYLANLMTALQQPREIHLPGFLIIDSPRKNFGSGTKDPAAGNRIYSTVDALRGAYGDRLQMLIADNDLPKEWHKPFRVITLSYEQPLIDRLAHPGEGEVGTLDTMIAAQRS
jgi:hypothetical protein